MRKGNKVPKKKETLFKEKVQDDLRKIPNCWFVKVQQVSVRGTPDILACVNGVFVAIELKTETGKLEELQEYNLRKIQDARGIAFVIIPGTWRYHLEVLLAL